MHERRRQRAGGPAKLWRVALSTARFWIERRKRLRGVRREALTHLLCFRYGNREAVPLERVLAEEILVVFFGEVERTERFHRRDDLVIPPLLGASAGLLEEFALGIVRGEHCRSVLGTNVGTLAIELRRIVHREEGVEDDIDRKNLVVKGHPDRFGVARLPCAHEFVARIGNSAARVARLNRDDPTQGSVGRIEAPEASAGEDKLLHHVRRLSSRNRMSVVPRNVRAMNVTQLTPRTAPQYHKSLGLTMVPLRGSRWRLVHPDGRVAAYLDELPANTDDPAADRYELSVMRRDRRGFTSLAKVRSLDEVAQVLRYSSAA